MKRKPTKQQIKLWNRLVVEVFDHPKSAYSIFTYELIKRRVLGTSREQFKGSVAVHKKLGIKCLLYHDETMAKKKKNGRK